MTGQQWYSVTDAEAQERLEAAWEDAPIENLETLGYILTTARLQVIAYAPAMTQFAPVTLTWPDTSTVELSRDGVLVTAVVTPAAPDTLPAGTQPLPPEFAPTGYGYQISLASKPASEPGRYLLNLIETDTGSTVQFLNTGNPAPYEPFNTAWAGDDTAAPNGIPENYVYAQLQQAINLWNAGRTDGNGAVGAEGWSFVPRPLDKVIRNIIRPIRGTPRVY